MHRLAVLMISQLAACDCSGNHDTPDTSQLPDMPWPDADVGVVPRLEPAACRYVVAPSLGLTEGVGYSCGDLVVNENRTTPFRHIRLHFIRFKSSATTNNATIYLDGGPGGDGQNIVDYAAYLGPTFLNGLMVDGDFLVLAQRGTALSQPYLDCQQADCSDYAYVADLPSYNTAFNADDVDDLRVVLGLDKLDVYGISYGSRLGLEVLRRHGDHVRAAVIEGLVPAQVLWTAAISSSFYSALTNLNASCIDAGACGTTFGDLVAKFVSGVDALNASPISVSVQGTPVSVDGNTYAGLLFEMFYSRSTYPWLPLLINDMAIRRTDRVGAFLAQWLQIEFGNVSTGLYYSVVCGEMYNPPDPSAVDTLNASVPTSIRQLFDSSFYYLQEKCSTWPKANLQAMLAQPVTSSARTLVSSGKIDPITPPTFGDIAAATLSDSVVVVHANSGHGATLQSTCGTQNLMMFLADPTTPHDTSCAATITTSYNVPAMFTSPTVPWARIRAELAIAQPPPFVRESLRR